MVIVVRHLSLPGVGLCRVVWFDCRRLFGLHLEDGLDMAGLAPEHHPG